MTDKVWKVITACTVLHNICKARQMAEPLEDSEEDEDDNEESHPPQQSWVSLQSPIYKFVFQASQSQCNIRTGGCIEPAHHKVLLGVHQKTCCDKDT